MLIYHEVKTTFIKLANALSHQSLVLSNQYTVISRAWHIQKFSLAQLSKFCIFVDGLVQESKKGVTPVR